MTLRHHHVYFQVNVPKTPVIQILFQQYFHILLENVGGEKRLRKSKDMKDSTTDVVMGLLMSQEA